ncbi:hypothetical protein BHE74_00024971, partial [Ensete ventricosum]
KELCNALREEPDLRGIICSSLQLFFLFSKATIHDFANIADNKVVKKVFMGAMRKLLKVTQEAVKAKQPNGSGTMLIDGAPNEASLSHARALLLDLAVSLFPGLGVKEIDFLFSVIKPALQDEEGILQKKAYKTLSIMLKAILGLIKVLVVKSDTDGIQMHLKTIVEGLFKWQDDTNNHFKAKVIGTRTVRYWAVLLKIDRRWPIEGEIDSWRSILAVGGRLREKSIVGGRLREKKGRRGKEEKRRGEERSTYFPRVILARALSSPSPLAGRLRVARALSPPSPTGAFSPMRGDGTSPRVGRKIEATCSKWNHIRIFSESGDEDMDNDSNAELAVAKTIYGRHTKAFARSGMRSLSVRSIRKRQAAKSLPEDFLNQFEDDPLDLLDRQKTRLALRSLTHLKRRQTSTDEPEIGADGRLIVREDSFKPKREKSLSSENESDTRSHSDNRSVSSSLAMTRKKRRKTTDSGWVYTGSEFTSKRAGGDVKRKDKLEPYAYWPLDRKLLNHRAEHKAVARKGLARVMKYSKKLEGKSASSALSLQGLSLNKKQKEGSSKR